MEEVSEGQHPDLRLQQLKMNIVPRTKPLQDEGQEREDEMVHTDSFRSARPAQRRENTWYYTADEFMYPLEKALHCAQGPGELFSCRKPQVYRKLYRTN